MENYCDLYLEKIAITKRFSESYELLTNQFEQILKIIELMNNDVRLAGYTYTQLTDVEQEKNGLYTYDRTPKCKEEDFAKIFGAVPERFKK